MQPRSTVKIWLLRITGAAALLLFVYFIYLWTVGFALIAELWRGTPLFLEHAGRQVQVSDWGALAFLVICPALLCAYAAWSLRFAARRPAL